MARDSIVEMSRHTGCHIETARYYERIGLLPGPPRMKGGHRVYECREKSDWRIGEHRNLQILRRQSRADRERKEVDELASLGPEELRPDFVPNPFRAGS